MRAPWLLLLTVAAALAGCVPGSAITYERGCVAADHQIASEAGAEMLARGGNAVDAAVATGFTLSVVRPYSCGIGGGGFMVISFSPQGRGRMAMLRRAVPACTAMNYRETAPAAIDPGYFERLADPEGSTIGGNAVAVPGTVAGLLEALDRYGTLDRATVLAPAIRAAEAGFRADRHYVAAARELAEKFEQSPGWKGRFPLVWDRYLLRGQVKEQDLIRVPEQGRVLRLIAEQGAAGFYRGPVAQAIADAVRRDGGVLTADDLAAYRPAEVAPLRAQVFGQTFITMPPPSSGGVAMLQTLLAFEKIMPPPPEFDDPPVARGRGLGDAIGAALARWVQVTGMLEAWRGSADFVHPLIESFKNAFADRARHLADPAFADVPVRALLDHAAEFAGRYRPDSTLPPEAYGTPGAEPQAPEDHGTSHFCVVDGDGSAVSCTETINLEFGSCLAVPEYGIILNNQMDDFTTRRGGRNAFGLAQSAANMPAPGKRPLSSMTPTIVLDEQGNVRLVIGASGGPRIITATTQCTLAALLNPLIMSDDILRLPRFHHQWNPDVAYFESEPPDQGLPLWSGVPEGSPKLAAAKERAARLQGDLATRGHRIERRKTIGEVQMIRRLEQTGGWDPACDPRKGGKPAGMPTQR